MDVRLGLAMLIVAMAAGCDPSGPPSVQTTSAAYSTLGERRVFLDQYVSFRRTYETLDFNIFYQNNGGGAVPGPSDWDIRLIATVPSTELHVWIPAGAKPVADPKIKWLASVSASVDVSGINEWHRDGARLVGIDRARRIVAYRLSSSAEQIDME